MVNNLPATSETQVPSLGWEDPLEKNIATHSSILAWRITVNRGAWQATVLGGYKELDMTEHSPPLEKASSSGLCLWVLFLPQQDVARMLWDIGRKGMEFPQGPVMSQGLQ